MAAGSAYAEGEDGPPAAVPKISPDSDTALDTEVHFGRQHEPEKRLNTQGCRLSLRGR